MMFMTSDAPGMGALPMASKFSDTNIYQAAKLERERERERVSRKMAVVPGCFHA